MSSHHHIRLATSHRIVRGGSDHETVGDHGYETVNVGSKINLDEVSVSQVGVGFTEEGGVVADDVIDGDTRGEGNTCKYVQLRSFLLLKHQVFVHNEDTIQ